MRVMIANRGEIAVRVVRACRELGMSPVIAHSEADRATRGVQMSDLSFCIGPGPATQSYLNIGAVLAAAQAMEADAIHPGYGFLSESAAFARACADDGITFIGPSPEAMSMMGDKVSARTCAESLNVPIVPGVLLGEDTAEGERAIREMGGSVLIKASAGGGGRGMRSVDQDSDIAGAIDMARAEATSAFGDGTLYAERFVRRGRHVEVQVFGLGNGQAVVLGERDCSVQRRHQKLIEESPCGVIDQKVRAQMFEAAKNLTAGVDYVGAGTVEFLWDLDVDEFYFLEMNTRLQVEHGVTEMRTGIDLVRQQLLFAQNGSCDLAEGDQPESRDHVIEVRVLAEDPDNGFRPSPGALTGLVLPDGPGVRVDTYMTSDAVVAPFYDSMIAKVLVQAPTREQAIARMRRALGEMRIEGVVSNIASLLSIIDDPTFVEDRQTTAWFDARSAESTQAV